LSGADSASFSVSFLETLRVGALTPISMSTLQDSSLAEETINRLLTGSWRRAVVALAINGDISPSLIGALNAAAVSSVDATGETAAEAIAAAAALVQGAGWYGPLVAVASPTTLRKVFVAKDTSGNFLRVRSATPAIGAWLPAMGVPDGQCLVLDPSELVIYLYGSFSISLTQAFEDYLARNLAALKGEQRVAIWVRNVGAFTVVENIS
jgi:hypothetical protein